MSKTQRQAILKDIRRVAADLKRIPSRDEYVGRFGKRLGKYGESEVKRHCGSFSDAVAATGLESEMRTVIDADGLALAKMGEENRTMRRYIRELEDDSVSASRLRELIGGLNESDIGETPDWIATPKTFKSNLTGIPTLFLSDIHFDEVVLSEQVNFVNEYNHEIAVARIKHTFETCAGLLKNYISSPKYEGIIVALGGDMLSGNIHEELAETNDQRINQSIVDLTDLLISGIGLLADEFGRVFVPCVVGNHGRMHKKPRYKYRVIDNYEWLVYQYIARYFKNDSRVTMLIPDAPDAQWTVYGRSYNLNHGDQFKGGSGISGIFSPLALGMARKQKKQQGIGQPFDVMLNGHWHQYIHTDSLIVNGSIKGYDEFANGHNFGFEPPQQALWITHPEKRENFRMPILCDAVSKLSRRELNALSWPDSRKKG